MTFVKNIAKSGWNGLKYSGLLIRFKSMEEDIYVKFGIKCSHREQKFAKGKDKWRRKAYNQTDMNI